MPTIAATPPGVIVSQCHFTEPGGGYFSPGFTAANGLRPHPANGIHLVSHTLVTGQISDLMSNPQ